MSDHPSIFPVAIISQARVNSTRLPGKIFKEAAGRSFLEHHVSRLKQTGLPLIIATTDDGSEEPIVAFCKEHQVPCFRGDEDDVLKRFYGAARQYGMSVIIRVTSDCPLIDPQLIVNGLNAFRQSPANTYYSNTTVRSYPRGMDYEIFSFDLLEEAFEKATDPGDREHVTPYLWKNRTGNVLVKADVSKEDNSRFRITLDTPEDQELITRLIEEYDAARKDCAGIVTILNQHPELVAINQLIEQKKV